MCEHVVPVLDLLFEFAGKLLAKFQQAQKVLLNLSRSLDQDGSNLTRDTENKLRWGCAWKFEGSMYRGSSAKLLRGNYGGFDRNDPHAIVNCFIGDFGG